MGNTITTNLAANTALRYLSVNSTSASSSLAKLSSGSRIVKASDDAASLAVGTKLKADVTALRQAAVNASHATSVLQVADGGMARIADILQRMKALAVQASSGSLSDSERAFLDQEYQQLLTQIDDIATQTRFNGQALLNGSLGTTVETSGVGSGGRSFADAAARGISVRVTGDVGAVDPDGTDTVGPETAFTLRFAATGPNGEAVFTLTQYNPSTAANDYTFGSGTASRTFTVSLGTLEDLSGLTAAGNKTIVLDKTIEFKEAGVAVDLSNFQFTINYDGTDYTLSAGAIDPASANAHFRVIQEGTLQFQVGVLTTDTIDVQINDVTAEGLGVSGTSVATQGKAQAASTTLDAAIAGINKARADLGALMSRFEFVSANLATSIENMDAARSVLMDTDVAAEMSKFASAQVLMQANVAMLAQANQLPQNLLRLLQ
ncbi:Flagellin D [bacterium HR39]|nr:Flagellin D [bacterium HR39]